MMKLADLSPLDHARIEDFLSRARAKFDRGDKKALLDVLYWQVRWRDEPPHVEVDLPQWAVEAFRGGYQAVIRGEHDSWDAVFGKPHGRKQPRSVLAASNKRFKVYLRVKELRHRMSAEKAIPIAAKEFQVSAGTAERYYKAVRRMADEVWANHERIGREVAGSKKP